MGGMNEAVEAAQRIAAERGDAFIPDQFSNPANPEIHRRTTAEEIWRDMDGKVDVLVAGVGTGGTDHRARRAAEGAQPGPAAWWRWSRASSPVLSGGSAGPAQDPGDRRRASCPPVLNREVIDEIVPVDDEDAIETARACARTRGRARRASRAAPRCGPRSRSARAPRCAASGSWSIMPDSGERYVSTPFFAPYRCSASAHSPGSRASCARTSRRRSERDPAARDVGRVEILAHLRRRAGAAGAPRRARAARGGRAAGAARCWPTRRGW